MSAAGDDDDSVLAARQQRAIDVGESLLLDFVHELGGALELRLGTKFERDERLRTSAHPVADVIAGDDEVFAALVLAADDDMAVGMPGVEMIDGHPIELRPEILLHVAHEVADEGLEIGETRTVLGRDDETELVRVPFRPAEKSIDIGVIACRIVDMARHAVARDAIALDVAQVRLGGTQIAGALPRVAGLDDDAAAARGDQPCRGKGAGTHAALQARGQDVTSAPHRPQAGLASLSEHLGSGGEVASRAGITDAAEFWLEAVIGHGKCPSSSSSGKRNATFKSEFKGAHPTPIFLNGLACALRTTCLSCA